MTAQAGTPQTTRGTGPSPADKHRYFAEACNSGDIEKLLGMYEPDAILVERTGAFTQGTAAIREHLETLLSLRPTMEIVASTAVVNGDLAQLSSCWRCSATAPDGSPIELEFRGSELDRRQRDGTWRIVIDNPWGAETMPGT